MFLQGSSPHNFPFSFVSMPPYLWKAPAKTREVMAMSFIRMLIEGPLVSFRGSPTVSPTTAALWAEVPLV